MPEIRLSETENKAFRNLMEEINQGKLMIGSMQVRQRVLEGEVIARENRARQLMQDKVATSGIENVTDFGYDPASGKIMVKQEEG